MTDFKQINAALERIFNEEGQRIVFWNDPDREFVELLDAVDVSGVSTLRLDQVGSLEAKLTLERLEPSTKFLLYSPTEDQTSTTTGFWIFGFTVEVFGRLQNFSTLRS